MMSARLRSQLEAAKMPPASALQLNDQQVGALLPAVVEVMDKMTEGVFPLPRQQYLLFHGLHVLAAASCQGLYRPLMRWLRSPNVNVERALSDGFSGEILPRVTLAVFDGDAVPLIEVIEDRTVNGHLRRCLFDVFARLVFDGAMSREAALALIDRFEQEHLADDEDAAWKGWQDVILLLGIEERADRVRASWKDGRNPQGEVDQQDWEEALRHALSEPTDPARFVEQNIEPLDDAVAALKVFYDQAKSSAIDDESLWQDPAAKIALTEEDLGWLAGFLSSVQAPDTAMDLETLDGFFTALIIGPELTPPSHYLPIVWGGDDEGPEYDSLEQAEYVMGLLTRHWNAIGQRLRRGYPCMPVISNETVWPAGRRWAEGFSRGVGLCSEAWKPLVDDEQHAKILAPIIALEREDLEPVEQPTDLDDREKMLSAALLVY